MAETSVVGKNVIRVDALEKVTGAAKFCSDLMLGVPGVLCGNVLRSPYPHARILKIDTCEAERLTGVEVVVTSKDAPDKKYSQRGKLADRYVLARDVVRYVGEPVTAVAAETPEAAEEALALIKVDYEELPAVFDPEVAVRSDPPAVIHPDLLDYEMEPERAKVLREINMPNVNDYYKIREGDVEKGFGEADLIVENRFSVDGATHCQPEPDCCIAQMGVDGFLTVWTSARVIYRIKELLCKIFGLPISKVRIVSPYIGGAFGRYPEMEQIATLLTLKTKKPVRIALTREEVFQFMPYRTPMIMYIKDGVKPDGTIVAREIKVLHTTGAYASVGGLMIRYCAWAATQTYRLPNFKIDSYNVLTNEVTCTTFRGVGAPQIQWAIESQMDILAEKLNIDPVEIRKRNILNEGERNALGETTHSIGVRECLDKVADFIEWGRPSEQEEGYWRRGKGVGIGNHVFAALGTAEGCAHVRIHEDGTAELRHSSDEVGQGCNTALAQMVAEEFGISIGDVRVVRGDSAVTPYDRGASSSRTTFLTGNAVRLACQDAKRQIFELAAPMLKASLAQLEMSDKRIFVIGQPERAIMVSDLFSGGPLESGGEIVGKGTYVFPSTPIDPETGQGERIHPGYTHGAQAVEVAVNVKTGQVKVIKAASAFDVGYAINPKLCEVQIQGGLAMGIGLTLYEKVQMDKGRVLNPTFRDYKMATAIQMPARENLKGILVETPHRDGPYGAKGVAEAVLVPVAPAIGNAICDAVGVRMYDLPITAERLLSVLKGKEPHSQ